MLFPNSECQLLAYIWLFHIELHSFYTSCLAILSGSNADLCLSYFFNTGTQYLMATTWRKRGSFWLTLSIHSPLVLGQDGRAEVTAEGICSHHGSKETERQGARKGDTHFQVMLPVDPPLPARFRVTEMIIQVYSFMWLMWCIVLFICICGSILASLG